jgi:hypothetical protein
MYSREHDLNRAPVLAIKVPLPPSLAIYPSGSHYREAGEATGKAQTNDSPTEGCLRNGATEGSPVWRSRVVSNNREFKSADDFA